MRCFSITVKGSKNDVHQQSVSEQQLALVIQKVADDVNIPTTLITNYAEFEKAWQEMDQDD